MFNLKYTYPIAVDMGVTGHGFRVQRFKVQG